MSKCWHCDKRMSLWTVTELDFESRCGGRTALLWPDPWPLWGQRRHEQALEAPIRTAIEDSDLPAAVALKLKFSDVAQTTYVAMNCPSCGYVQGDGLLEWRWNADEYAVPLGAGLRLPLTEQTRARPHFCRDIGRGRCSQAPSVGPTAVPGYGYPPTSETVMTDGYREENVAIPPRGRDVEQADKPRTESAKGWSYLPCAPREPARRLRISVEFASLRASETI
jgi:hypothetical protein